MRRHIFRATSLMLMTVIAVSAQTAAPAPAKKPGTAPRVARSVKEIDARTPKLPPFAPQQPIRIQLENGMVIFLQEDHELPFINGMARIRGGSRDVAPDKTGMMGIYGQAWRTGGTKSQTGDALDDFLEARAAEVETSGGLQSTNMNFSSLKGDFEDVFKIFVDLLQNPEFREDKVELAKKQAKTGISRRNEDPGAISSRESAKVVYGPTSPYARHAEYWTIDAVTRPDLLDFHKKFIYPNNIILGLVGDFDAKQMEARLRKAFSSWPKGPEAPRVKEELPPPVPGVSLIEKEDVNQSTIKLLTMGTRRDNPDFYAITVMNEALGGGFASRLFSSIRSRQGLAYSVGGGIGVQFDYPGMFQFSMGTKSETTGRAVKALFKEIDGLKTHPFTQVEVDKAKANILNSWIFNFDTKEEVLAEKMLYEFYGYPLDTLEKFRQGVEKTTVADVNRVVEKYIDKNKFSVLVLGKSADFDEPLSEFGKVNMIDVTIPTAPPGAAKATETASPKESNAEGKALIAKVVNAMGGKEKLAGIKAVAYKTDTVVNTPQGELPLETSDLIAYPDRVRSVLTTPMGEMTMVLTPGAAFQSMGGQSQEMPPKMRDEALKGLKRDPIWIAQHADDPKYVFAAGQKESDLAVLDILADGVAVRWYVGPDGHVQRSAAHVVTSQGPAERETTYSEFRDVNGVTLPSKAEVKENGQVSKKVTYKEINFNPAVDEKTFAKQ